MRRNRMTACVLFVALLMTFAMGAQAQTQIELWFDPANQIAENLQPVIDRFNAEHPGIEAVMIARAPNPNNVLTAAAGDALPNVILGAHSWSPTYAANGLLVDLWPYIIRDGLEAEYNRDFFPGALVTGNMYREQLIGLPLQLQIEALYYNPHVFDQFGVAVPDEGWTWDDLAQMVSLMTRRGPQGNVTSYGGMGRTAQNLAILFQIQNGATIWDEETYRSTVDRPEFREATEYLLDLAQRQIFHIGQDVHLSANDAQAAFMTGQAAIYQDGTYRLPAIEQDNPDARVLPLPRKNPGDTPVTMLTQRSLNIVRSADPAKEQASWAFLKWFMDTENLAEASVRISVLAGRPSVLQNPAYAEYVSRSPHISAFATLLAPYSTGVGFTGIPGRDEVFSQAYVPLTVRVLRGDIPVPAYIDQLHQSVNQILEPYR